MPCVTWSCAWQALIEWWADQTTCTNIWQHAFGVLNVSVSWKCTFVVVMHCSALDAQDLGGPQGRPAHGGQLHRCSGCLKQLTAACKRCPLLHPFNNSLRCKMTAI